MAVRYYGLNSTLTTPADLACESESQRHLFSELKKSQSTHRYALATTTDAGSLLLILVGATVSGTESQTSSDTAMVSRLAGSTSYPKDGSHTKYTPCIIPKEQDSGFSEAMQETLLLGTSGTSSASRATTANPRPT